MIETAPAPEREGSGPSEVADDLPCFRCGYNVRGLARDGACPECAAAVRETLRRQADALAGQPLPIDRSDPRWVRTVARGCAMILIGGIALVATRALWLFPRRLPTFLAVPLYLSPTALLALGVWLTAAREPVFAEARGASLRMLTRFSLVAWACTTAAQVGFVITLSFTAWEQAARLTVILTGLITWCFFWRFRGLAVRLGHAGLRRRATSLAWLTFITHVSSWAWLMLTTHASRFSFPLDSIQVGSNHYHALTPVLVTGYVELLLMLPYSLAKVPRFDPAVVMWSLMLVISVESLLTLARFRQALRLAAARGGPTPPAL